jgi:hypothetical protein
LPPLLDAALAPGVLYPNDIPPFDIWAFLPPDFLELAFGTVFTSNRKDLS